MNVGANFFLPLITMVIHLTSVNEGILEFSLSNRKELWEPFEEGSEKACFNEFPNSTANFISDLRDCYFQEGRSNEEAPIPFRPHYVDNKT